jgi:hypothetical protein
LLIRRIIDYTPFGKERANKAEELLNKDKEDLRIEEIDNIYAIEWVICRIIDNTIDSIERINKAKELLINYKQEITGKKIE